MGRGQCQARRTCSPLSVHRLGDDGTEELRVITRDPLIARLSATVSRMHQRTIRLLVPSDTRLVFGLKTQRSDGPVAIADLAVVGFTPDATVCYCVSL